MKVSLRAISVISFVAVASAVLGLAAFSLYVGRENARSIEAQKGIESYHDAAQQLRAAIDETLYYGAEMSNSLSDGSLNRFEAASRHAESLIAKIDDPALRATIYGRKQRIEQAALAALDAYVADDRALGDANMAKVRDEAAILRAETQSHVALYRGMRDGEADKIRKRSALVERTAIIVVAIAVIILLLAMFLIWSTLFDPIRKLIDSISSAAERPDQAIGYQIPSPPNNEIGDAARALNRLLEAVSGAIAEARARSADSERAEKRWKALFNESPDAIIILDPVTTRIIDSNPSTRRLLCLLREDGSIRDDATGYEFHHHEMEAFQTFINRIRLDGSARSDNLSCALGEQRVPVSVVGVTAPHEDSIALLLHVRDISAQRRHETELNAARIEAERANVAKSNFLANMSHEIRTPMNGVIGMADVLINSGLAGKQREIAEIIVRSGNSLIAIINDILDFSKLEAGKFTLSNHGFNLRTVVQEVGELLSARAIAKDIELIVQYSPTLPEGVVGDASRIRQVLTNLAGNAVKFTENGHVHISVSGEAVGGDVRLRFEVEDTGIGIAPDDLPRMFEKFVQADSSKTRRFEGTGLGLAICRELVDLMGGRIGANSVPGAGSTFWFELSVPIDQSIAPAARSSHDRLSGLRVLAVDDNAVNRRVLAELFEAWGLRSMIVTSAEAALLALDESVRLCDRFHLVVTDYHMPGMNGDDFIACMQERPHFTPIPVIMLSSVEPAMTVNETIAGRYARWIAKPIRASQLLDAMLQALSDDMASALFAAADELRLVQNDRDASAKGPLVLLAEDNVVNQIVFRSLVDTQRYRVEIVDNGRIAVEKFEDLRPDIIVMDLSMPEMDGFEATAAIRRIETDRGWTRTPIIAATAHVMDEDREACRAAGMDDFVAKPMRRGDLSKILAAWSSAPAPAMRSKGDLPEYLPRCAETHRRS